MKQRPGMSCLFSVLVFSMLLTGCSDPEIVYLDRELAEIRSNPGATPRLELPAIPEYELASYDTQESRSPFLPREAESERELPVGSLLMPELNRAREPLEAYDLSELALVGTLSVGGQPSALVRAPNGQVHRLRIGNYLGLSHGRIVGITGSSVLLVELVVERGGWVERSRQLSLDT